MGDESVEMTRETDRTRGERAIAMRCDLDSCLREIQVKSRSLKTANELIGLPGKTALGTKLGMQ